jgi:hypothetical protein
MAFAFVWSAILDGGGEGGAEGGDTEPGGSTGGQLDGDKRFTQDDLNRAAGAARDEGRQKAFKDWLKKLGAGKLEDVEAGYQAYVDQKKKDQTELEAAKETATQHKTKSSTLESELNALRVEREVERQALALGANPERLSAVVRLREPREGEISDEDGKVDVQSVKASVEAVLKAYPEFKNGAATVGGGSNPPKDDPKTLDEKIAEAQKKGDVDEVLRLQTSKLIPNTS